MATTHIPILLEQVIRLVTEPALRAVRAGWVIDLTLGGAGHTGGFLKALEGTPHRVFSIDWDFEAIERAEATRKTEIEAGRLVLHHGPFSDFPRKFREIVGREDPLYGVFGDLGFSSDQIEDPVRGLSFLQEGPIDMRLSTGEGLERLTAHDLMKNLRESELADLIYEYGEERHSRRIAYQIKKALAERKLETTADLARAVSAGYPSRAGHSERIHPATRTFQALRIAVNRELEELDQVLTHGIMDLEPGGRAAFLTFHSLEDRRVKHFFQALTKDGKGNVLTKKPMTPDEVEITANPRSRSAKLRVFERGERP